MSSRFVWYTEEELPKNARIIQKEDRITSYDDPELHGGHCLQRMVPIYTSFYLIDTMELKANDPT